MYDVYICYSGFRERVSVKPVRYHEVCDLIDGNHDETLSDLKKLLKKPSVSGLHNWIRERFANGDDYEVVDTLTGEIVLEAHRNFNC